MSNATALQVMRLALQQYGYKESPAGSNKTKFGKAYGWNGVAWCAEFSWWCGWIASGKNQSLNPIAKSANAADIQILTVKNKGGKYILKQTSSNSKKKAALPKYKFGDEISFNFSGGSARNHTGLIVGVSGSTIYCIEGNTSFDDKGSQSNGGCVALRKRSYTTGVCVVRPKYASFKWYVPTKAYTGKTPKLPSRGYFKYKDKGSAVKVLQDALSWANGYSLTVDGEFGAKTFAEVVIFQVANGLVPDGEFGEKSLAKMKALINKHKAVSKTPKADKIVSKAMDLAWKSDTPKSTYVYPSGRPKEAYKKALDKAYPDRSKWTEQTRKGASCDVFVGTTVRASGVDKNFPRGLDEIIPYMKKNTDKWKDTGITKESQMKPGDIIYEDYGGKGTGGHVSIYLGNGKIAQAQHGGKTYPHRRKYAGQIHDPKTCDVFKVYRVKE